MEKWKNIPDFEGYQVSNLGRVRTHNKITSNKLYNTRKWKDRILKFKGKTYKTGYRVDLWKNGKPHSKLVARLVAFTFYEKNINDKSITVNHIDGNRFNNNLENLELITLKENIQHGFRMGLYKNQIKIKIENKINGTTIFPSSLSEGSKIIGFNKGYLSNNIKKKVFENNLYKWEII